MKLNLPVVDELRSAQSLLLAGMGGGFDILGAIPLLMRLRDEGKAVHLASLSFSPHPPLIAKARGLGEFDPVPVSYDAAKRVVYFPELHLAQWLRQETASTRPSGASADREFNPLPRLSKAP